MIDYEAFGKWLYGFTAPPGVIPWKRLSQQRREAFVKEIRIGLDATLGDEPLFRRATMTERAANDHDVYGPFVRIWPEGFDNDER